VSAALLAQAYRAAAALHAQADALYRPDGITHLDDELGLSIRITDRRRGLVRESLTVSLTKPDHSVPEAEPGDLWFTFEHELDARGPDRFNLIEMRVTPEQLLAVGEKLIRAARETMKVAT